jgi:hypothetical protein
MTDWEFWNNGLGGTVYVPEREPVKILDAKGNPIYVERKVKIGFDLTKKNENV